VSFTILNCGTSYSRAYQNELIADFGRNMAGKEYDDFLITEGPGGSAPNAPLPGTFNPFSKAKTLKEFSPKWAQTPKVTVDIMTLEQKQVVPSGEAIGNFFIGPEKVKGQGWDDNVRHAVTVLADKFPKFDGEVNMVGFSRGAVTCLRIANWLQEFLGTQWELNIFAIDPVAGLDAGLKLQDTRRVPKIVKEYVGILAMDELRGDYKPGSWSPHQQRRTRQEYAARS
jgi:hypothetical protein